MATKFPVKTKKCARKTCLKTKPIDMFPHDKREHDKHSVWCKQCWSEYQAARKAFKVVGGFGKKDKVVKVIVVKSKAVAKKTAKTASKKEYKTAPEVN